MDWHRELTVINGAAADVNPRTAPGSVPSEKVFRLPETSPGDGRTNSRLIVGLDAPVAENIDFEVWALDSRDDSSPFKAAATDRWYLLFDVSTLAGGAVVQTRQTVQAEGYVGGGLFYLRITAEAVTADRKVVIRAAA